MMLTTQLFRDIIRPCPACDTPYDCRLHAPHVLPCSHTFCLMCLSKHEQRKKRNCPICKQKYSKFAPNLALMEAAQRIDERRHYLDAETRQCDECDNRVVRSMLRHCETCEKQFVTRTEYKLECIVCLECCVNTHNGHELKHMIPPVPPSIESSPMVQQRARRPSTSSAVSVHFRPQTSNSNTGGGSGRITTKGIINTIKSWSFRTSNNELSFMLTPRSKVAFSEEDIVMQSQSPFYDSPPFSSQHHRRTTPFGSSRYICYDTPPNDNTSVDSVFAESPQSLSAVRQSSPLMSSARRSHHLLHQNDSGVMMSTPSSVTGASSSHHHHLHLSHHHHPMSSAHHHPQHQHHHHHHHHQSHRFSATSLCLPSPTTTTTTTSGSSSLTASKIQTIQECFGTQRVPRNTRILMGVTDIVTPRRPLPMHTSTPNMKTTRSENSIFPPTPPRRHKQYI